MKSLRAVFGFFTILPLGGNGGLTETARGGYLLPLVAVVLGGLEGLAGWGAADAFGQPVSAALMLAAALLLTGLHHTDGLADLGDALMAHGSTDRRLEVLKDRTMGAGAAGALILTYLITWAALLQVLASTGGGYVIVWCLIAAELAARLSLLTVIAAGRPSHTGSGSMFLETMRGWRSAAGIILSLAALAALAPAIGAATLAPGASATLAIGAVSTLTTGIIAVTAAAAGAVTTGLLLTVAGRHWFGGVGGDVLGASVELGRAVALLGLAAALLHP